MGDFTFYFTIDVDAMRPYIPAIPVMLPASSFCRKKFRKPKLPVYVTDRAADCGGFVASRIWGEYRYTPEVYNNWCGTWDPLWAATMDWCCEDELTSGNAGIVRDRQTKTTEMAWHFWDKYKKMPWAWVPTIQGWHIDDYLRHAEELLPLARRMRAYYTRQGNPHFRLGIGTLCRRGSVQPIQKIINAVACLLGDYPLHLWGTKLTLLKSDVAMPRQIVSMDSAAWNSMFPRHITMYRKEWQAMKIPKQRYLYEVQLPRYASKITAAMSRSKQPHPF